MIRRLLRPLRLHRARTALQDALQAVERARERKDTRALGAAYRRARQARHALMAVELGR
jgi:hypothetical protein